jgi:alanine racemase
VGEEVAVADEQRRLPADRWAWVEVDLGAVRRNARALMGFVKPGVRFCAVVKANGYGHGAVPVAKACKAAGADAFAVATVEEALELRRGGITEPVIVLAQPPLEAAGELVANRIEPAVYDVAYVGRLGEEAQSQGTVARYHLAVDTGMTRIGVACPDVIDFVRVADRLRGVELAGTFTHFATADVPGSRDFALQLRRFRDVVAAMRAAGVDPGLVHCANTPSIVLHPEAHFDMVRAGVGLYGLHPADSTRDAVALEQAMSVRARATRVVEPEMGEGVGYGMTYRVPRPGVQIATLPIGYADGLARSLSNKLQVAYRGRRYRQVGNICMDQCMVEVEPGLALLQREKIKPIEEGDEVTILGRDGGVLLSVDAMAAKLGTINYEVVCRFGLRLPKVYV